MNKFEIKNNYKILHFDEFPILFIGKNYKSESIIGSFIFEDDEDDTIKYFHSIVNTHFLVKFLKKEMSYLEVLKNASFISIVTKDYNDAIIDFEVKTFAQLDKSFLPLSSAYCPINDSQIIIKFERYSEKKLIEVSNNNIGKYTKNRKIELSLIDMDIFIPASMKAYKNCYYGNPVSSNNFISHSKSYSINKSENKINLKNVR